MTPGKPLVTDPASRADRRAQTPPPRLAFMMSLRAVHAGTGYQYGVFPLKWPLQLSGEFVYVSES